MKFVYQYDFGTTTNLSLRVLDERPSAFPKSGIHLLARNEPPEILCASIARNPPRRSAVECECCRRRGTL